MTITLSENVAPSTIERILDYIKHEKVPYVVNVPNGNNLNTSKSEFLDGFKEALIEAKYKEKTGETGQSLSDFLDEVEQELELEKNVAHAD